MHALTWLAQDGPGVLWAVVIFAALIFIHEFGHFLMAKLMGVKILEFSLGFGQKIFGWEGGGTQYGVRLFPIGGYVKMLGEGDEGDPDDPGNFQNKLLRQKVLIVAAGPVMNYVLAIFLLFTLGIFYGVNTYVPQISQVVAGMPAAKAGLKADDIIVSVNGERFQNDYDPQTAVESLVDRIRRSPNVPLHFEIRRGEKTLRLTVTPQYQPKEKIGLIGILPVAGVAFRPAGFADAAQSGLASTAYFTKAPFVVFAQVFQGKRKFSTLAQGSAGPVGIGHFIVSSYSRYHKTGQAFPHLVWLAALLNIFIGLFNLFPIPALDGSRIFFMVLGKCFGKPLNHKLEEGIHLAGFAFLLIIMVLVTYQDIWRIVAHKTF